MAAQVAPHDDAVLNCRTVNKIPSHNRGQPAAVEALGASGRSSASADTLLMRGAADDLARRWEWPGDVGKDVVAKPAHRTVVVAICFVPECCWCARTRSKRPAGRAAAVLFCGGADGRTDDGARES